jgi:hypothetical protein
VGVGQGIFRLRCCFAFTKQGFRSGRAVGDDMFLKGEFISVVKTVLLGAVLLAYPCNVFAQHGGGGAAGRGGESAGGLSAPTGRATGVSEKDELKDYREVLAVQATSQQVIQYAAMVKISEAAGAELRILREQVGKESGGSELSSRGATLDQALEKARAENKKFTDGLSERQKSGLKEIIKRLTKADSELEQQAKALDQVLVDAKAVGPQIAGPAENLDRGLTAFRSQQADLGQEMSIGAANGGQDFAFHLTPVKNSINFRNQPVAIVTSGVISAGVAEGGQNTFKLELTADLSDLQDNMTAVLRAQLNKADRCGEQIGIRNAALSPRDPATLVVVQLHYERWACFGRNTVNEMAEGDGTIEVKLTPAVGEDGTLRLVPEVGRIDAQGMVGELLRSGSLGDAVRDAIVQSVLSTVRQGGDFKVNLPATAQGYATLRRAQFEGTGAGRVMAVLDGEIRVSSDKATALTSELRGRSLAPEGKQEATPEGVPR